MTNVDIKRTVANSYYGKDAREVEKLSREVFNSLESVISEFEEFVPLRNYYNETGVEGFLDSYDAVGSVVYKVVKGNLLGSLNIEFFAKYEDAYNKVKIELFGPEENFDANVVKKLIEKFQSFV